MTTEEESHIVRTNSSRMAKGIAIIVVVMAIGAAINLGMGDFWHKFPPPNQLKVAAEQPTVVTPTGKTVELSLTFVESADLRTLGFNKPAGEEGANPDVEVTVGDKVIIHATNGGKMPHAFGVVSNPEDPNSIVFNAKIKSADNPILKGQTGSITFIADRPGNYFYICTVPGHSLQGMQGNFIVE
jgi:nitrite reductase (NO-forming)